MVKFEFYDGYLELHDNHTLWHINKDISINDYADQVTLRRMQMEEHFKDLEIYLLGRTGRHVCVEDTPVNRRRYACLVEYADRLENDLIDYFNNEYEYEQED